VRGRVRSARSRNFQAAARRKIKCTIITNVDRGRA
jgi:hypothetical protein